MKPKIEKVIVHSFSRVENCCIISYHPTMDLVLQTNFISEENARKNLTKFKVGIWKRKKCECNMVTPIVGYENTIIGEQCTECGRHFMIHPLYELDSVSNKHFKN